MAKELGDLIVRLSLESSKFDDGLKRLESQMSKVQQSFTSSVTGVTNFDKVTKSLKDSAATLTERLGMQRQKVDELEKAYQASVETKGKDADETKNLERRLEEARQKLSQTEKALELVNQQINAITEWLSGAWASVKETATTAWDAVCTAVSDAVTAGKVWISGAWDTVSTAVSGVWDTAKTTATTAWNAVCTNAQSAVSGATSAIQSAWTTISTGISTGWTLFKATAGTSWTTITGAVSTAISGAKEGIVGAWDTIKAAIKTTWDGVKSIFETPVNNAITWLTEKVEWFKGLFSFEWKLPSFKLPKIDVTWNDIGWGIKLPKLSLNWNAAGGIFDKPTIFITANAGLQGVGEAGPEAILPLNTLWAEMSARLKSGMREILVEMDRSRQDREVALLQSVVSALHVQSSGNTGTSVQVTQHIYANETSYAGQQREAARNFRQIARAMG